MQTKTEKPKTIKPTILLADGWEKYFTFRDFIGFKSWDAPILKKKKRGFVVNEYQMCNLVKLDESKLFLGSFSDMLRGMIYSGLFAIVKCNNMEDKVIDRQIGNMRCATNISNNYIEELLSKTKYNADIESLFSKYGNNYICKKYYRERFDKDLIFSNEPVSAKINSNIKKLCFEITDTKPNIYSLKIEKNKETKSVSLWIPREILLVVEKVQQVIHKDYMVSEILRGALLQGLYMIAWWIIFDKINTEEQDTMKLITGLENIITNDIQ